MQAFCSLCPPTHAHPSPQHTPQPPAHIPSLHLHSLLLPYARSQFQVPYMCGHHPMHQLARQPLGYAHRLAHPASSQPPVPTLPMPALSLHAPTPARMYTHQLPTPIPKLARQSMCMPVHLSVCMLVSHTHRTFLTRVPCPTLARSK